MSRFFPYFLHIICVSEGPHASVTRRDACHDEQAVHRFRRRASVSSRFLSQPMPCVTHASGGNDHLVLCSNEAGETHLQPTGRRKISRNAVEVPASAHSKAYIERAPRQGPTH